MPLGIVPVEEDGSVYCEAPVGKAIYFQLLDEKGMAVQSMRSATYVHPGESLSCMGCHEDKWNAKSKYAAPLAMKRAPSKLVPEVIGGAIPFNFYQLVKIPVFDRKCVDCHKKNPKAPDMSFKSLARNDLAFSGCHLTTQDNPLLGIRSPLSPFGQFESHKAHRKESPGLVLTRIKHGEDALALIDQA